MQWPRPGPITDLKRGCERAGQLLAALERHAKNLTPAFDTQQLVRALAAEVVRLRKAEGDMKIDFSDVKQGDIFTDTAPVQIMDPETGEPLIETRIDDNGNEQHQVAVRCRIMRVESVRIPSTVPELNLNTGKKEKKQVAGVVSMRDVEDYQIVTIHESDEAAMNGAFVRLVREDTLEAVSSAGVPAKEVAGVTE